MDCGLGFEVWFMVLVPLGLVFCQSEADLGQVRHVLAFNLKLAAE